MNIKLGDLGVINTGNTPSMKIEEFYSSNDIPFIKPDSFGDMFRLNPSCFLASVAEEKARIVESGAILVTCIGTIGKVAITNAKIAFNQQINSISVNNNFDSEYIAYNILFNKFRLQSLSNSAVVPIINKSDFSKFEIKVEHNLEKQIKIKKRLNKVNQLKLLKEDQIRYLDLLIKSRFEEMFGDLSYLKKEMKKDLLSDYLVFLTSGPRGWAKYYSNDGSLFITIKNLVNHQIDINDVQYIDPPDSAESKRTRLLARDLLISITADLGRTAVVTKEIEEAGGYINQHIALMRLDLDLVNPVFLSYCLESDYCKRQIIKSNQNGVKAGLNFKALKNLSIVIPKIELQNKFEEFVIQINKLKFAIMVYN